MAESRIRATYDVVAAAYDGPELHWVVATCKAIYITVDPSVFAQAPDPR